MNQPTRVRYLVLFAACSAAVMSYVHRVGFARAVGLPQFVGDLHLSEEDLGYLTAAFLLAYGTFEIPGGLLADRLGVRHVLTILVLGWSLMTGLVALAVLLPGGAVMFAYLLVIRFLFGMFQAGGFPCLSRLMTDWTPPSLRASAQGLMWMSSRLGGALVPLLFGALYAWLGDWKTPLWLFAGLGVAWCAVFWPWFRNRPAEMPGVNEAERQLIAAGRPERRGGPAHLPWGVVLRSRSIWGLFLMYGGGTFSGTFFVTLLPSYLSKYRHLTEEETSWLSALPLACGVLACILGGILSDWLVRRLGRKWGRRLTGFIGQVGAGVAIFSTTFVPQGEVVMLAVLLCLTFFGNDLSMGPAWAACADLGESYAGTLGGAMNMFGNMCAVVAAGLTGYLLQRADWQFNVAGLTVSGHDLLFVLFGGAYFFGSLSWLLVDVTRPLLEHSSEKSWKPG